MTRAAGAPGTAGSGFRLADVTDPRFTAEQLETVAAFETAATPPEVRELHEVAEALTACHLSGKPYKPQPSGPPRVDWSEFAGAAVAAYRAAQDGGAEAAVRRVEAYLDSYPYLYLPTAELRVALRGHP